MDVLYLELLKKKIGSVIFGLFVVRGGQMKRRGKEEEEFWEHREDDTPALVPSEAGGSCQNCQRSSASRGVSLPRYLPYRPCPRPGDIFSRPPE